MILPIRRDRMGQREALDRADELRAAEADTPAERIELVIELSDLARHIGEAAGAEWALAPPDDLADKSARLARPLQLVRRS